LILVVEDDDGLSYLIKTILQRKGFTVRTIKSGEEALRIIPENPEALVLMDFNLLDMSGKDVIEKLAEQNCYFSFIIMTGLTKEQISIDPEPLDIIVKDTRFIKNLAHVVTQESNKIVQIT